MSQPMRQTSHEPVPQAPVIGQQLGLTRATGPTLHARALQQKLARSVAQAAQAAQAPTDRLPLGTRMLVIASLASLLWAAIGATVWTVLR